MNKIFSWLKTAREQSKLSVELATLPECKKWSLDSGSLSHDTGHFFHIRGVCCHSNYPAWNGLIQPMIDQSEVGILAFLIRSDKNGDIEWLLQAKTEPGTINGTQIAPSIQATFSNYSRVHGGKATRFLDFATSNKRSAISDTPQSEQGSHFLWKFNRNAVLALSADQKIVSDEDPRFRWFKTQELRYTLGIDYTINTDSRSVIATSDWSLLTTENQHLFRSECLYKSYISNPQLNCTSLLNRFLNKRKIRWEFISLNNMDGWNWDERGLRRQGDKEQLAVGFFDISLSDREVKSWSQPLVMGEKIQNCILFMRINKYGIAQFWVRVSCEIGFGNRMEFGPSIQDNIDDQPKLMSLVDSKDSLEISELMQSDEGSRFMKVLVHYRIILIPDIEIENDIKNGILGTWVSLSTLQHLTIRAATTNNELRSIVSLLLSEQFDNAVSTL